MRKPFAIALAASALVLAGCGPSAPQSVPYEIRLEMWGLFDDQSAFSDAIEAFDDASPYSEIGYKKKDEATYREDLLRAFAAGNAPDVFLIRNSWLPDFADLIAPAPEYLTGEKEVHDTFVEAAVHDTFVGGRLYGVPLSVDSLALYYNRDLFNAAGIVAPPATWDEFASVSKRLTTISPDGEIVRSGASFGTASNVNRASDVLLALAFQRGLEAQSQQWMDELVLSSQPMVDALGFYGEFARIGSDRYSWNSREHYSIDAFYEGTLAMTVNYSWKIGEIRRKNAKLNFATAPLPQFDPAKPGNYANYWIYVVAKKHDMSEGVKSKWPDQATYDKVRIHEAWQFLHMLAFPHQGGAVTFRHGIDGTTLTGTITLDPAERYAEKTGKPAARKDLVGRQIREDAWLSPFAAGNLVARSWRQPELERAEMIINDAIDAVSRGESSAGGALNAALKQIEALGQ